MARRALVMVALVFFGFAGAAGAQIDSGTPVTGLGGGSYLDPHTKAAKAYRQGLKFRQRAEKAAEAAEREALYKRALEKFFESVGYVENFDARLGMGEVYLVLGNRTEACKACHIARFLKPRNERARQCYEAAGGKAEAGDRETPTEE